MDKRMVWSGAVPLDLDILQPQRNSEIALGFLLQAAFGTGTVIDGLSVTQTVSPSMGVLVGPGSIIVATTVDTVVAGFGSLPVSTAPLNKIGINLTPTTLTTLTAPGTAGQSQNTLVEAQFLEVDGSPVVLPYYNSANPSIPFTGPANAGTPNNTARTNTVQLQYKQGTAAATGSQTTPAPDAGWVGVAVITIANGQSSVLNANITQYTGAPIVPTKLPFLRIKLTANLNLYVSATGNDLSSGLSASVPFATLQKAWNVIVSSYDMNGFAITINLANGTYTSGLNATGVPVGNTQGTFGVNIVGNAGSPSSVIISATSSNALSATVNASFAVSGCQVTATGSGVTGCGIYASSGGSVTYSNVTFAACSVAHIWANGSSLISCNGNYTITAGSASHWAANSVAVLGMQPGINITVNGTPAFSTAFANASGTGVINAVTVGFTGPATGVKYNAQSNGLVNTAGGGPGYLPGSIAGVTSFGGQYV